MKARWPQFGSDRKSRRHPRPGPTMPPAQVLRLESRSLLALVVRPVVAAQGVTFQGQVATFTSVDDMPTTAKDYLATINWGDGTPATPATIQAGSGNQFQILGTHNYSAAGGFGLSVTLTEIGGVSISQTGVAQVSAATLSVAATPFTAVAGQPFSKVVATALDSNPLTTPDDFTATINWGDGTPATSGMLTFKQGGGGFNVNGTHTYAQSGSPSAFVTVTRIVSGQFANTSVTATVSSPASHLTGSGTTITPVAGVRFSGVAVATFQATPPVFPGNFVATIHWGDEQTSAGTVVAGADGQFTVLGSHTYGSVATRNILVTVTNGFTGGSGNTPDQTTFTETTIASQAVVQAPNFTGGLAPRSDTGPVSGDGYTRLNQLTFTGTARPFSLVQLYSQRPEQLGPILLGQAAANADGAWTVFAGPLADGAYAITATVTPSDGSPILTASLPAVTIDTLAPRIANVAYYPLAGTVVITFRDEISGLDVAKLQNPRNYNLIGLAARRPGGTQQPASVSVETAPTGSQTAVVTIRIPQTRSRFKAIQVVGAAITDLARNPLAGGNLSTHLVARRAPRTLFARDASLGRHLRGL